MGIAADAQQATLYLWEFLMLVWLAGMFMTRRTVRRQTSSSRFWQTGIMLFGVSLLYGLTGGMDLFSERWIAVFMQVPVFAGVGMHRDGKRPGP